MEGSARAYPAVASLLARATDAGLGPGWVGLVAVDGRDGTVWSAGRAAYGGPPTQPDVLYDLASLTKPLVVGTLLMLANAEGVELETPLSEVLPELHRSPWDAVTLLQCATHTAGFPAWEPLYALGTRSREGYLESLAALRPIAPAGTQVTYSCPGFVALGLALERLARGSLDEIFTALVAEPLGIAGEIGFAPPLCDCVAAGETEPFAEIPLLAERGIPADPPAPLPDRWSCDDGNARGLDGVAGNAGLFGTAAAVARIAAEFLPGGGDILDAASADLATTNHTHNLQQARGIAWQLAQTPACSAGPALAPGAFGHTGFTGTSVWAEPGSRRVMVLLGNRLHPGGRTPDLHPLRRRFHALAAGLQP